MKATSQTPTAKSGYDIDIQTDFTECTMLFNLGPSLVLASIALNIQIIALKSSDKMMVLQFSISI